MGPECPEVIPYKFSLLKLLRRPHCERRVASHSWQCMHERLHGLVGRTVRRPHEALLRLVLWPVGVAVEVTDLTACLADQQGPRGVVPRLGPPVDHVVGSTLDELGVVDTAADP